MKNLLEKALLENNLLLSQSQIDLLIQYLNSLSKWNNVFNLTSITNEKEMIYLHIIDSLLIDPLLIGEHVLDVGSGAGLPGIPLAILNPKRHWTLLDKSAKKTRFLVQMKIELQLTNVEVITARCEDFHPAKRFDSIISRAFGTLSKCVFLTQHLLAQNGLFIFMKGKLPQDEIDELPNDIKLQDVIPIAIKGKTLERHVVRLFSETNAKENK